MTERSSQRASSSGRRMTGIRSWIGAVTAFGVVVMMVQERRGKEAESWQRQGRVGVGVSICFQCEDALAFYREVKSRGIETQRPFVGNGLWVVNIADPDGYRLSFESPTDAPEESVLSE